MRSVKAADQKLKSWYRRARKETNVWGSLRKQKRWIGVVPYTFALSFIGTDLIVLAKNFSKNLNFSLYVRLLYVRSNVFKSIILN